MLQDSESDVPNFGTTEINKSGWNRNASLKELLSAHWDELSAPEQEEICFSIDAGLTEEQLRRIMLLPLDQMAMWRRAYVMENGMS